MRSVFFLFLLLPTAWMVSGCSGFGGSGGDVKEIARENISSRMKEEVQKPDSFICEGINFFDTITLQEEIISKIEGLKYDLSLNDRYVRKLEEAIGREAPGFQRFKDRENLRIQNKIDSLRQVLNDAPKDEIVYIRTKFLYRQQSRNGSMVRDSAWAFLNPDLSVMMIIN